MNLSQNDPGANRRTDNVDEINAKFREAADADADSADEPTPDPDGASPSGHAAKRSQDQEVKRSRGQGVRWSDGPEVCWSEWSSAEKPVEWAIEQIIKAAVIRRRKRKKPSAEIGFGLMFSIVRQVMGALGMTSESNPIQARKHFRKLHSRLTDESGCTEDWDSFWGRVLDAWARVKKGDPICRAVVCALEQPLPEAASLYDKRAGQLAVAVVAQMSRLAESGPFGLPIKRLAEVLGCDRDTASNYVRGMVGARLLKRHSEHVPHKKAREYTYHGDVPPIAENDGTNGDEIES